ncbi:MAG: DsbA family protein [Anaerolineae bacterium]|nr:DsbA family protein [Anaerolineae bacterium]
MQKLIAVVLVLLVIALPASAQDAPAQPALPAGCNVGTLGTIFTNTGESMSDASLTAEEAVYLIDMLDGSLAALRAACVPDEASDDSAASPVIDYTNITQSRTADGAFVLGEPDAPITIVEFADFLCPHCQTYHETIQEVIKNYVATGQAKVEYRFFPVIDANVSPLTARMTECADILNSGSFWEAHDMMYELVSASFNGLTPFTFAAKMRLNYDDMVACVSDTAQQIETDYAVGQAADITGTPSVMVRYGDGELEDIQVDGQAISRSSVPYMVLSTIIEAAQ